MGPVKITYLLIQVRVVFHSSVVLTIPHEDYGDLLLMTKIKQRKHYYSGNRKNITDFHNMNLNMVLNTSPIQIDSTYKVFFSNFETYAPKIVKLQCQNT